MNEEPFDVRELAECLQISEANLPLLKQALTHKSSVAPNQDDNERLEFLGDSILGVLTNEYLFHRFPERAEGELTRAKAAIVSEPALAEAALKLGIGNYMLMSKGEETSGGRMRPSMLADTFEALIAAVYLDGGLESARGFVLQALADALESVEQGGQMLDFKSSLQEILQERHRVAPVYVTVSESGPDHDKTFVAEARLGSIVLGTGTGHSKKEAEQAAAQESLESLLEESANGTALPDPPNGNSRQRSKDIPCISWRRACYPQDVGVYPDEMLTEE